MIDNTSLKNNNDLPGAVFFDWDGTLVDTIPGVLEAHNHVRGYYGLELWELAWFKKNMRQSALQLYPGIYGDKAEEALAMLYSYIEEHHLQKLMPLPGAVDLLWAIRDMGLPMAVISNKKHQYLVREIAHMGWDDLFIGVIGAGIAARDKPDPDPILTILRDHDMRAQDVWYIGDTETDLLAAQSAECTAVLILNGENKDELVEKYSPQIIVSDCVMLGQRFCKGEARLAQIKTC